VGVGRVKKSRIQILQRKFCRRQVEDKCWRIVEAMCDGVLKKKLRCLFKETERETGRVEENEGKTDIEQKIKREKSAQ
jgi:hypothetical protein